MGLQLRFEDVEKSLEKVKFLVIDVETTGASAVAGEITEIGAVVVQGGRVLDSYQSLLAIDGYLPAAISELTGIYPEMLQGAPTIQSAMLRVIEMADGAVIVGHNVGFDLAFVNASINRLTPVLRLDNQSLDTLSLARKLLIGEVSDFKLGTLAEQLRLDHQPAHRAMADVLATVDLLHYLIERASSYGAVTVRELLLLPNKIARRHISKLRACNYLPRQTGVYWTLNGVGEVTYVGKARDLNVRFRSYFSSDTRRKVDPLLGAIDTLCYMTFDSELESLVAESRLIQRLRPRFNSIGKRPATDYRYISLEGDPCAPTTRILKSSVPAESGQVIGPFRSRKSATLAESALRSAFLSAPPAVRHMNRQPECQGGGAAHELCSTLNVADLSNYLWNKLAKLSDSQLYEQAEKLRVGSNFLMLAMVRQYATMALGTLEHLELTSASTSRRLIVHRGAAQLRIRDAGAISLGGVKASAVKDASLAACVDPPARLDIHRAGVLPELATFEEVWIVWKHLVASSEFLITDPNAAIHMPISLSHQSFLPKKSSGAG